MKRWHFILKLILGSPHGGNSFKLRRSLSPLFPISETCLRNRKKGEYFFLFSLSVEQEFSWTKKPHYSLLESCFSIWNKIVDVSCECCDVSLCMAFTPVAPEFLVPLVDITCLLGDTVMLQCKICGRPKPTITWKGPDQNMLDNDNSTSAITVTSWYVQSLRLGFCWGKNEWINVAIESIEQTCVILIM